MTQERTDAMTVLQAASLAGVSTHVIYMWIKRGGFRGSRLRATKFNDMTYVSRADLERIIAQRSGPNEPLFSDTPQ